MKLNAKSLAALTLPAGKSDVIFFDDTMPGFGFRLRAGAGGKLLKSWVVQYKRAGRTSRMLLGNAEVVGAEAARLAARKALGAVAMGQDPAGDRRDRRAKDQNSLRALIDEFLAEKERQLRPRTFVELKRYLTTSYFRPLLGMPVDTISRRDVSARVVAIARESGAPTAGRAKGALGSFFVWARRMGLCESNPTIDTAQPEAGKPRERTLDDVELASIWRACGDLGEYGNVVKLLILTGCRRAEIGDMAWSEIDLDRGTFTIPANRSKNGRTHTLPLMPMALDIIRSVPKMASRDQLFGQRSHGFTNWALPKPDLDQRAGVVNWVVHDIRRTVATGMANLGVQPHVIEAVLGHHGGFRAGVAGVYNRSSYEREMRAALATWHDHLRVMIDGGERKVLPYPAVAS